MSTYSPKIYAPEVAEKIFSEVLFGNRTMSRSLIRGYTDIKYSLGITSATGEITWGDRVEYITEAVVAAAADTIAFSDAELVPKQIMAFTTIDDSGLRNSARYGKDMKKGAFNITSDKHDNDILDYAIPRLGKSYERMTWVGLTAATKTAIAASSASASQKAWAAAQTTGKVDGLVAIAIAAQNAGAALITVVGTTVTATNILTEYTKIFSAVPAEIASHPDFKMFVPPSDRSVMIQYNLNATYRDTFTVTGLGTDAETWFFANVPVEFVEMQGRAANGAATGAPARMAGIAGPDGDFAMGTDLESDQTNAQTGLVNTMSTLKFLRMDATLATALMVPQQKVLYL